MKQRLLNDIKLKLDNLREIESFIDEKEGWQLKQLIQKLLTIETKIKNKTDIDLDKASKYLTNLNAAIEVLYKLQTSQFNRIKP